MTLVDTRILWSLVALCVYTCCVYAIQEEEYVCSVNSTTDPIKLCNVSASNNTYIVLIYRGSDPNGFWIRGNKSGPYIINGHSMAPFQPICWNQTCTINKTLNNSDSGPYFFIPHSFHPNSPQEYPHVIVNVLAPPGLLNVDRCDHGENRCYKAIPPFVQDHPSYFDVSTEFIGNGPFTITWTFNDKPYICSEHKTCLKNVTEANRQILRISTEYPTQVNGSYVATVSNKYGYIEEYMLAHFDCNEPAPHIGGNKNYTLELSEGSVLNYSCNISGLYTLKLFGCYTRDKHKSFTDIENDPDWPSYCASLPLVESKSINRSSSIIVQKVAYYCPALVQMIFQKEQVTRSDSGLIYCAYLSGDEVKVFATVNFSVYPRPINTLYFKALIPAVLGAAIVASIMMLISYRFYKMKNKNKALQDRLDQRRIRQDQHRENYERRMTGHTVTITGEQSRPEAISTQRRARGSENEPLLHNSDSSDSSYHSTGHRGTPTPIDQPMKLPDTTDAETQVVYIRHD